MTKEQVLEKIQNVFRNIFDQENLVIGMNTTANDVEGWDSLNHVNLISSVEEEFGVEFTLSEMGGLKNVGDLVDLVFEIVNEK